MNGHYILCAEYQQRGTLHIFGLACDDEHHLEDSDLPQDVQHWQQLYYNNLGSPQHAFSICLVYHKVHSKCEEYVRILLSDNNVL